MRDLPSSTPPSSHQNETEHSLKQAPTRSTRKIVVLLFRQESCPFIFHRGYHLPKPQVGAHCADDLSTPMRAPDGLGD